MHLFWQKRIRDSGGIGPTPWWYPSETGGGAIKENRLVLPLPMGVRWDEAVPVLLPGVSLESGVASPERRKRLTSAKSSSFLPTPDSRLLTSSKVRPLSRPGFGAAAVPCIEEAAIVEKPKREKKPATKNDPALVKKARDLRDRWFEHVNADAHAIETSAAKYAITAGERVTGVEMIDVAPIKLLAA